jgi:hypothetical protein
VAWERRDTYIIEKPEVKIPFECHKRRWENNIKENLDE